jgi:riboflavin synthase
MVTCVFTGLVETTGRLRRRTQRGPGARLELGASLAGERLALGESVSVDGTCLSVALVLADGFEVDASAETLARTTLGALPVGHRLNLERALRVGDRLGGHLVTGHVDAVCSLLSRRPVGEGVAMTFSLPGEVERFVAEKGSVTVSGVSLTVNAVRPGAFDVMLVPVTLGATNLGDLASGDRANLEVDLVARYVARFLG